MSKSPSVTITSFEHYLKSIQEIDGVLDSRQQDRMVIFRGQSEVDWELVPNLGRHGLPATEILDSESRLIAEFKRRAFPYIPKNFNINSEWDWLALAQHQLLPTRLLDWSENPIVSLWFACQAEKERSTDRCVWVFFTAPNDFADPNDPHNSPYNLRETKVFMPNQITQRITVQSGWFTVHKHEKEGFIPLNHNRKFQNRLTQFIIPERLRSEMLLQLDRLGINSYSIFPDLDGLSNYLAWKFFRR